MLYCVITSSVLISVSKLWKHELPVDSRCTWWHPNSITKLDDKGIACPTVGGRPVGNYSDVLGCMSEAHCTLTGEDSSSFTIWSVTAFIDKGNYGVLLIISVASL